MYTLIAARALQGLGAGAVVPLSMTIIGELYTLAERARTQALFSGVWGVASVAGPLVGGYITDALSWRWVFYLNIPFGLLAVAVIAVAYPRSLQKATARVDWRGAALMFAAVSAFLLAVGGETGGAGWWLLASLILGAVFILVERRTPEPILPLGLFKTPVVARTLGVVFLLGNAMFGAIAFIPLFVQAVLGGSATQAGRVLTPLFLGWVATSVLGAKLTVQLGYRRIARSGVVLIVAGFAGLATLDGTSSQTPLLASCFVIGAGMGFAMLSLLLALQHGVERSQLGIATSLNQFSRSIGAAAGIAVMGALMTRRVGAIDFAGGSAALSAGTMTASSRAQFAAGLHDVFVAGTLAAAAALAATLLLPKIDFRQGVPAGSGERMLAAEMTNLEPDDEPSSLL
jgi:MFS family permease